MALTSTRRRVLACLSTVCVAACAFEESVPAGARIKCGGKADCPDEQECSAFLSVCVRPGGDIEPPEMQTSVLSATRLGPLDVLQVELTTNEDTRTESILQVGIEQSPLEAEDGNRRALRGAMPAARLGDGVFAVSAVLVDAFGNAGASILGTVIVDADPPGLIPGSTSVVVRQPLGTVPVADPALAVGGAIDVAFRVDDLVAEPRRVAVVRGETELLLLAQESRDGLDIAFSASLSSITSEGDATVVLELVDDVGNLALLELATVRVAGAVGPSCLAHTGDGTPVCTDADNDGAFGPGDGCAAGVATDCDDSRHVVHPGAVDLPDNGLDEDCSGTEASIEDPDIAARTIFVVPGGADDAPGTREEPIGDLFNALARAEADPAGSGMILIGAGEIAVGDNTLYVYASLAGGWDDQWQQQSGRTVLRSDAARTMDALSGEPMLISGLDLVGPMCTGLYDGTYADTPLMISDVHFENNGSTACSQFNVLYVDRPTFVNRVTEFIRCPNQALIRGLSGGDDLRVVDSELDLFCEHETVLGIWGGSHDTVVRTRILARGLTPLGINTTTLDLMSSWVEVEDLGDPVDYASSAGISVTEGILAHNTLRAVGPGTAALEIDGGAVLSNELTALGDGASSMVVNDYYAIENPAVFGNQLEADPTGCLVRFGGETTCTSINPCTLCSSAGNNAVAPEVPAPQSAVDLGAPSGVAFSIDGVCREPVAAFGAD